MFFTRKKPQPIVVVLGGNTDAHLSRIARQLAGIHGQLDKLNQNLQDDSLSMVLSSAESLLKAIDMPNCKPKAALISNCAASFRRTIDRIKENPLKGNEE